MSLQDERVFPSLKKITKSIEVKKKLLRSLTELYKPGSHVKEPGLYNEIAELSYDYMCLDEQDLCAVGDLQEFHRTQHLSALY